jgi:energy-converting hydrogenase Eha subunit A
MPSLIRLLVVLGLIAAVVYGAMVALVISVEPKQHEMSVRVSNDRLQP